MTHEIAMEYLELCRNEPKKAILYAIAFVIFFIVILFLYKRFDNEKK